MLKKIGIPVLALAALFVLFTPTPAAAQVRFGVGVYGAPPVCAYPGYYDRYCYAAPYNPYYYGYSYPYPYSYYYGPGYGYGYYGRGFRGGERREFRAPERGRCCAVIGVVAARHP